MEVKNVMNVFINIYNCLIVHTHNYYHTVRQGFVYQDKESITRDYEEKFLFVCFSLGINMGNLGGGVS